MKKILAFFTFSSKDIIIFIHSELSMISTRVVITIFASITIFAFKATNSMEGNTFLYSLLGLIAFISYTLLLIATKRIKLK